MTEVKFVHSVGDAGLRAALSGAPAGIFLTLDQAREIEWPDWDNDSMQCAVCRGLQSIGHAPDCWLAAKIKQAEEGMLRIDPL